MAKKKGGAIMTPATDQMIPKHKMGKKSRKMTR